jgi:DNA modification methylase
MKREPLARLDADDALKAKLLPFCRLAPGEIWTDPVRGHRVGVLDAASAGQLARLTGERRVRLCVADPPYNLKVGNAATSRLFAIELERYLGFSRYWVKAVVPLLERDAHLYVWMGADQNAGFQPLPDFMLLMREFPELRSRSLITMRNQRGYGTQKNWMCVRQELLYYTKGRPEFTVRYTSIPKILKGYYKEVGGRRTENLERSRADCIRPGNVWVDIQQVFYRMEENVPGAYAQKPLRALERVIESGTKPGELVLDPFAHAGTTLIAAELSGRVCFTSDIDPVFAELTIRRLERLRKTGKTGWQCEHPFPELEEAGLATDFSRSMR